MFFQNILPFPSPSSSLFELIEHIFDSNLESVEFCDCGNSKSGTSGSRGKYSSFWVSGDIGGFEDRVPK